MDKKIPKKKKEKEKITKSIQTIHLFPKKTASALIGTSYSVIDLINIILKRIKGFILPAYFKKNKKK